MDTYVQILSKIQTAVICDDVDSYKISCALLDFVNKSLDSETIMKYQENACITLTNANLICLACKYSSLKVLQNLLSNENNVCSLRHLIMKKHLLPEEEDEECHNAIYYAIRSNKTEFPKILFEKWLNEYFREKSDGFDDLLSKACNDLNLRNVFVCEDMKICIKQKLVDLRFFNKAFSQETKKTDNSEIQNLKTLTKLRMDSVIEAITFLRRNYLKPLKNEHLLLFLKFIAKAIHMLKYCIKCSDSLPWEQIEFCLIIYIRSCQSSFKKYPWYNLVMNKERILKHLGDFSGFLKKLKDEVSLVNKCKLGTLLIEKLKVNENFVDFTELYDDFTLIRDLYSLEKIKGCIDLAMSADISEKCDQLVIIRVLQVIGECMKNTTDSPNLSTQTFEQLINFLPVSLKGVITQLRNSLSHAESLSLRAEMEKGGQFFSKNLRSDVTQMNLAISYVIRRTKTLVIAKFMSKLRSKEFDVKKCLIEEDHITVMSLQDELKISETLEINSLQLLENLLCKQEKEIKFEINCAKEQICRIQDLFQKAQGETITSEGNSFYWHELDLPINVAEIQKILAEFICLPSIMHDLLDSQKAVKYVKILRQLLTIKAFNQKLSNFKNFINLKQFSLISETLNPSFALFLLSKCDLSKIEVDELNQFEERVMSLKNVYDDTLNRVENMFQEIRILIDFQKSRLKRIPNHFRNSVSILLKIIQTSDKQTLLSLGEEMLLSQDIIESVTKPFLPQNFSNCIQEILVSISSDKNLKSTRNTFQNAMVNISSFLFLCLGKTKWITELQQILHIRKKRKLAKHYDKVSELNDRLKSLLFSKLNFLGKLINKFKESKKIFENSEKHVKLISVIEMLTLDSMTILGCSSNSLTHNAFFLDNDYPIINGKNLRNHLAHGNAIVSIVSENESTDILLNAEALINNDLFMTELQIGKKVKNDPQRNVVSLLRDFFTIDRQMELFAALAEGNMEKTNRSLSNGADMLGRDLCSRTALHFAARAPCLETVKFVLTFNLDVSARDNELKTALHNASTNGRLATVEYLIQEFHAPINIRDIKERTPLHYASANGHTDVVKCLLQHGAKTTVRDLYGKTALDLAVTQNHTVIVNILLENVSNGGDSKIFWEFSALHSASAKGHINLVEILLQKMNINFKSDVYCYPLHHAARGGHTDVVQFLIIKGACVNTKTMYGATPLHEATSGGHYAVVEILLKHGADVNATDIYGMSPLSMAATSRFLLISELLMKNGATVDISKDPQFSLISLAAHMGHYELVNILIPKSDTKSKISALHSAVCMDHFRIVELLVNNEIDVKCNHENFAALHFGAFFGRTEMVNFLLSKGCDINAKVRNEAQKNLTDKDSFPIFNSSCIYIKDTSHVFNGETALHISSTNGHKETVRTLLKNNANVYIKNDEGETPLYLIIENGMSNILIEECIPLISENCEGFSPLQLGAALGDIPFVRYCIQEGWVVNASTPNGFTALYKAAVSGRKEMVSYLIDCGAEVNAVCPDGNTALHGAIISKRADILNILIEKSGGIDAENERKYFLNAIQSGRKEIVEYFLSRNPGNSAARPEKNEFPLHDAVLLGHLNIVKILLELDKRKVINDRDNRCLTPLQVTAVNGNCEIARLLLLNGADPNIKHPLLPLHTAIKKEDLDMIEILINAGADVNLRDREGYTAIELAVKGNNLEMTETLLEYLNQDLNVINRDGGTLLHFAAVFGSLRIIKSLVNKEASINCRDGTGAKPIHIAAKEGHQDVVEYFLTEGIDIEDRDLLNFWSLMHFAAAGNQPDICKYLIRYGLGINTVDCPHIAQLAPKDVLSNSFTGGCDLPGTYADIQSTYKGLLKAV